MLTTGGSTDCIPARENVCDISPALWPIILLFFLCFPVGLMSLLETERDKCFGFYIKSLFRSCVNAFSCASSAFRIRLTCSGVPESRLPIDF